MSRSRFTLLPGLPPPPEELEARIAEHIGRRLAVKRSQKGLEIGRADWKAGWGGHRAIERRLIEMLDEVEPRWRSYYTLESLRISAADERWLSEATLATAKAKSALRDDSLTSSERAALEAEIEEAYAEADRRGLLPRFSHSASDKTVDLRLKCAIDANGRLFLPKRWHGYIGLVEWDGKIDAALVSRAATAEVDLAAALYGKADLLIKFRRSAESLPVFDEIVERFGHRSEPELREQVAAALVGKIGALIKLTRLERAKESLSDLEARFKSGESARIDELLAEASKGLARTAS